MFDFQYSSTIIDRLAEITYEDEEIFIGEEIKDFKSLFNNMKITTERNPQFDFLER